MLGITKPTEAFPLSQLITDPNIYNNESWVQQQEELFTIILNEVLEPISSGPQWWSEPAFDGMVKLAFDLYQSDQFQTIRMRLLNVFITASRNPLTETRHSSTNDWCLHIKFTVFGMWVSEHLSELHCATRSPCRGSRLGCRWSLAGPFLSGVPEAEGRRN